jgi:AmmeMemoRadiSam system protein B
MSKVHPPAVAGMFYPANPAELRQQVADFLAEAKTEGSPPKAIVAPHAGYIYSGPIAGTAYARIVPLAGQICRVVMLGPAHRLAFRGLAFSSADIFRTPLGDVKVDRDALDSLRDLPQVHETDAPFQGEHCLEVQLPFLQTLLKDFSIVPLLVGDADAEQVAEVLERLWGGDETLVVISSDLSHYLDYGTARDLDERTSRAVEDLRPEDIGYDQACGRIPLSGLLLEARRHGLSATTLDLRNSGDTAGPRNQVVGYGAYVFS